MAARIRLYVLPIIAAFLCVEAFLTLVVSRTRFESLWYTGKIHRADPAFGFVFQPDYDGWMRHNDKVYLQKLSLNAYGFRNSYGPTAATGEILMLGGYSMAFSYGLADSASIHSVIGKSLGSDWRVHNTAWPGFHIHRNFHAYRNLLENHVNPKVTVIAFYDDDIERFATLPAPLDSGAWDSPKSDDLFFLSDEVVIPRPSGFFQGLAGKYYLKSLVLFSIANKLDRVVNWTKDSLTDNYPPAEASSDQSQVGRSTFIAYVDFLNRYFSDKGSKVLFVFLPAGDHDRSFYAPLIEIMPQECTYNDLHSELRDSIIKHEFIALNHYSRAQSELIGNAIAHKISQMNP